MDAGSEAVSILISGVVVAAVCAQRPIKSRSRLGVDRDEALGDVAAVRGDVEPPTGEGHSAHRLDARAELGSIRPVSRR